MNAVSPTKTHKCKVCKGAYVKRNPWQSICQSTECVISHVERSKAKRERLDRAETRQKLDAMATKPELVKKAQIAFNAYIRARDYGQPCISCGKALAWGSGATGGVCDAGHYLSVGARVNLRFSETNCHAQCKHCNNQLSGNAVNYRLGLIERVGLAEVERLERDHVLRKYTHDGLREIEKQYKQMTKALKHD